MPKQPARRVTIKTDKDEQAPNGTHDKLAAGADANTNTGDNVGEVTSQDAAPTPTTPAPAMPAPAPTTGDQQKNVEEGPLTFKQAVVVVAARYNNMFKSIQMHTDPLIRDGSVVTFKSNGVTLGQGVLRVGTAIIFDDAQNTFLSLMITNISYGQEPLNFRVQ